MVIRFGESLISDGGRVDHTSSREYLQQTGLSTQKSVVCGGGDCDVLSWQTVSLLEAVLSWPAKVFENMETSGNVRLLGRERVSVTESKRKTLISGHLVA